MEKELWIVTATNSNSEDADVHTFEGTKEELIEFFQRDEETCADEEGYLDFRIYDLGTMVIYETYFETDAEDVTAKMEAVRLADVKPLEV